MSSFTQSSEGTQASTEAQGSQIPEMVPITYTIGGVTVMFPHKAYPSQLAMMNKVIQGLKHRQNCLLESPTGSGKSLALLCSALAWQRQEAARVEKYNAEIEARQMERQMRQGVSRTNPNPLHNQNFPGDTPSSELAKNEKQGNVQDASDQLIIDLTDESLLTSDESITSPKIGSARNEFLTDDEDDFQPMKKSAKGLVTPCKMTEDEEFPRPLSPILRRSTRVVDTDIAQSVPEENYVSEPAERKLNVPKIYFGTRTHKQISQITRELRKTQYRNTRSVILASREHTCVNPLVARLPNKNEACKELLDNAAFGGGCLYHLNYRKMGTFSQLQRLGVTTGYDLEELVTAGKHEKACPYFANRQLKQQADIIFCPYNYLIDPAIRKSMDIDLVDQIVIFDEAHNMEDASREAASFTIAQDEIQAAMQDFEKVGAKGQFEPYAHQQLANLLSVFSRWMDSHENNLQSLGFDSSGKYWNGTDVLAEFDVAGMPVSVYQKHLDYLMAILRHREEEAEKQKERGSRFDDNDEPKLNSMTIKITEDVLNIFQSLTVKRGSQRDDFRIALLKSTVRRRRDGRNAGVTTKEMMSINIWCLNPAVAFEALKDSVHSIVLTSGTLSPMQSFQSELDAPFPIKLEASHVIDRSQVFAAVIGLGPNNIKLKGDFRNVETFQYQDELGQLVLRVCREIPYGVLCFFPSYRLLEKVSERWRSTGLWHELNSTKLVLTEPRSGSADFEHAISSFYEANTTPFGTQTGAMFLAVCRGKVSEGIDFADNNARAVICVGIPFPNFKDLQVELKRDYNQMNVKRGLLPGGEWYEIQAFRALNQALGRCIRHRQDWGAIVLVDERYTMSPRYIQSLSKWVRNSVDNYKTFGEFLKGLHRFRENMMARPTYTPSCSVALNSHNFLSTDRAPNTPISGAEGLSSQFFGEKPSGYYNNSVDSSKEFPKPFTSDNANNRVSSYFKKNDESIASNIKKSNKPSSPGLTIPQLFKRQTAKRPRSENNW